MRQITISGRFEDACTRAGFCPAPYLSNAMQAKHCADGCCPDCGLDEGMRMFLGMPPMRFEDWHTDPRGRQ